MTNLSELRERIESVFTASRFPTARTHRARIEFSPAEEVAWEIFLGHLLDASRTRERKSFDTWHVFLDEVAVETAETLWNAPLISARLDWESQQLHVTRQVLIHGWEAFEVSPGVIDSRPTKKWLMELVGTIALSQEDRLAHELERLVTKALLGTSRLPITSLEAPLPAFSLGQFFFVGKESGEEMATRTLEFQLRGAACDDVSELANDLLAATNRDSAVLIARLTRLFNDVSLTPYTRLVENLVQLLSQLSDRSEVGGKPIVPLVATMLRLLTRHLTAFDLVRFHSFGANYPDALVLDSLLRLFLDLISRDEQSWREANLDARRVRRAMRLSWLLRKQCEQLLVPEAPTSLGENQRVLPEPFRRVAEDQIADPKRRTKRLFENEPAEALQSKVSAELWRQVWNELAEPNELRELGTGLFLDRPLGIFLEEGAVDRTPLLSYEAVSRTVASQRLEAVAQLSLLDASRLSECRANLETMSIPGFAVTNLSGTPRRGVVSLEDAKQVAEDFVFTRTTRRSLDSFVSESGLADHGAPELLAALRDPRESRLLIRTASASQMPTRSTQLTLFNSDMRPKWRIG